MKSELAMVCAGNDGNASQTGNKLPSSLGDLLFQSLDKDPTVNLEEKIIIGGFENTPLYRSYQEKLAEIHLPAPVKPGYKSPIPVFNAPGIPLMKVLLFKKKRILSNYEEEFDKRLESWQRSCEKIDQITAVRVQEYNQALEDCQVKKQAIEKLLEEKSAEYTREQKENNEHFTILSANYPGRESKAVEEYFNLVLLQSDYPDFIKKNIKLEYHKEPSSLFVAFEMPHPGQVPREKEVSSEQQPLHEVHSLLTDDEFNQRYNNMVYQILLRTINEIFSADYARTTDTINFYGWVRTLNKGNGQFEDICIASLVCSRTEFEKINLRNVDPSLCFKFLKGHSGDSLAELIPEPAPHFPGYGMEIEKPSVKISEPLESETNLAGLGMEEFEKNIIKLFESEFGMSPGDIILLHESQDGSFEAFGIDPEPIRGGRLIIQARKSTKPVSVAAVKELFGAVIHEGAVKGILITTADFLPDAYEFARNKPLVLLNGNQLLALFEKHGIKARISFREAISLKSWLS